MVYFVSDFRLALIYVRQNSNRQTRALQSFVFLSPTDDLIKKAPIPGVSSPSIDSRVAEVEKRASTDLQIERVSYARTQHGPTLSSLCLSSALTLLKFFLSLCLAGWLKVVLPFISSGINLVEFASSAVARSSRLTFC